MRETWQTESQASKQKVSVEREKEKEGEKFFFNQIGKKKRE